MKKVTASELAKIAELAHVSLSGSEKELLAEQISEILSYFERIQSISTRNVSPTSRVGDGSSRFREDEPPAHPKGGDANPMAPEDEDGLFKVPKVLP